MRGRSCIPWGRLEKADWMDTKNLMLDFYGGEAALDVAIAVFERIQLHYRRNYKRAIRQAYSRMKDQNARVGDDVSLNARYSKLVIVNKQPAGVGKTMTARKIMLDWASDKLFAEFDYVFYIHCREGNLLTSQASMADLITQCCPGSSLPLAEMLVLFVIDGFDELRFSFDGPQSELCSQPWEQRPVEITLSSLFRKRLLPESSLLVTTRPAALRKPSKCLECERYAEILGFSEAERKEYFHRFFENAEQAAALYLSALLRSLSGRLKRGMPGVLRRLCCLAADGVWKQKVLFEEKEVQGYALDQREALPLLLNEHLFQKDISCVSTYSFIHLSFQEFFAALFYLLEDEGEVQEPPAGPTRDVKELLESYGNSRNYFMLTVRFLFGLLNEERRRELEEEMGCKIAPRITRELLAWVQNQDERFVATVLEPFTGVYVRGLNLNRFDQMVLSFSVKNFPKLESLDLGHCSFLWDDPEDCVGPQPAKQAYRFDQCQLTGACCRALASVISRSPSLMELDLAGNEDLRDGGVKLLCEGLRCGACQLQTLRQGEVASHHAETRNCRNSFTPQTISGKGMNRPLDLASVLGTVPSLVQLDLSDNTLGDSGVRELCRALAGPGCSVQKL
ncbi:PREDICTED: NACHT, LRR and PYD domains-containing protein 3-like, partial [Fulmarus glacialis]|uniref:NACHT, LRR and PYD domains-containing protein 3-like n=1 Tax=Fulmarus glacialis TaxID=30455 RepID=UPI00051B1281